MMIRFTVSVLLAMMVLMMGCTDRIGLAPVVESHWAVQNNHKAVHRVQRGETLYAIAFRYDKDYQKLAAFNHLHQPYILRVGQRLNLQYPNYPQKRNLKPSRHVLSSSTMPRQAPQLQHSGYWYWPVRGRVVTHFMPSQGKKGIDIASKKGEAVYASAPGVVAYAGNGLRGYGNLIIIRHSGQYLTAYGNNTRNLVHEGEVIKVGQRIAEVGVIDRRFWGVHFEIRKAGQPVNPLNYLKRG